MQETPVQFWVRKMSWRSDRLPTPIFLGFPCTSTGQESACNAWDLGSIPGLGRSPAEGKRYPLQYSSLENSMDCIVHGVTKSQTQLSDFHYFAMYSIGNSITLKWTLKLCNFKCPILNLFHVSFLTRYSPHVALSFPFLSKDLVSFFDFWTV